MNHSCLSQFGCHTLLTLSRPTREMTYRRTEELARFAGRAPHEISQTDYDQAKREVTGESDPDRQQAILDQ